MQTNLFDEQGLDLNELPGSVDYVPSFIETSQALNIYNQLVNEINWQQPQITVFGNQHLIPRKQCWMGDDGLLYQYSGHQLVTEPWHQTVKEIQNKIAEQYDWSPNSCLLNYYRNGGDKMGWHSDDEPELGAKPLIMIVSLGGQRTLQFKHKTTQQLYSKIVTSGSLLIMHPSTQSQYKHQVPVRKKQNEARISLTFRFII